MEKPKAKITWMFKQDDWVPEEVIARNGKLGKVMAVAGLKVQVNRGTLITRTNPKTKETEYQISELGKEINMNWNALK